MKILIAAGSSGGHIYPAVSTAFKIRQKNPNSKILFVGTREDLDARIFQDDGYDFEIIPSRRFLLKKSIDDFKRAYSAVERFQADVAVGFGGYVSFLILFAAKIRGIPCVIHEQNLVPGAANRLMASFADKAAISFEGTRKYLFNRSRVIYTGNPLRVELLKLDRKKALNKFQMSSTKFTILVMGGSQGSHTINTFIVDMLKRFNESQKKKVQVVHLSGEKDFESVKAEYENLGITNRLYSFFDHIWWLYSMADLIICRAGATSISEISYFGKPSVLIPYPKRRIHQLENAMFMQENGAAIILEEPELSPKDFKKKIFELIGNRKILDRISANSGKLSRPDAAEILAGEILNVRED